MEEKEETGTAARQGRSYISIHFSCCNVYQRVYKHKDGRKYVGFCPRCLRQIIVPVGPAGTARRIFQAE